MEKLIESLWHCLPGDEEKAKNVIHRVAQYFQRELTTEERDLALHILLEEEKGIGDFVSDLMLNKSLQKIVSEIFILLSFLVENHKSGLEYHVVKVKDICVTCLRNPSSSNAKDKALDTLAVIVRSGAWSSGLDTSSLISTLVSLTPSQAKKATATVLRRVYSVIGNIAELYPHDVYQQGRKLLRLFLSELQYQTSSASKVDFLVIEGCFDGLSGFLHSFPQCPTNDSEVCLKITSYIRKVLACQETSKHTAHRAALNVLARHGSQFSNYLIQNYKEWHNILCKWLTYGIEERISAKFALLAFYQEASHFTTAQDSKKAVVLYFISHFKNKLALSQDIDIVIKGFGLFAKSCKEYLPEEIPVLFNILARRAEEVSESRIKHKLADFLESVAALCVELGDIQPMHLAILEGMTVQLIICYPFEELSSWQAVIQNSIILTMLLLNRCSATALDIYLNTIVYQGMLRTVSHPMLQDVAILKETGQKLVTYENYLPLWCGLVTLNLTSNVSHLGGIGLTEKQHLSSLIFDKIIYFSLEIIRRLDLSVKERTASIADGVVLSDVEKCLEAIHPNDFTVLVNLVDFLIAFLNDLSDTSCLNKWISPLLKDIIKLSTKHPLVSSFYKLLASVVKMAMKLGYFDVQDCMEDVDWRECVNLLSGFLYDVIVRQSQYKGDLQVACLLLMLAIPSNIATTLFSIIIPAYESVFRIGSSMLSLAQEGLCTLRRWNQETPKDKIKPLFVAVLPMLDRLLQTKDIISLDKDEDGVVLEGMESVKKVARLRKRNKRSLKHKVHSHVDTELLQLQREVLLFLSGLDSDVCLLMLEGSGKKFELMTWQKEKFLLFPLPYLDMKISISFDDLLPRLSDLALSCSDRQTRSSACELLHAVIMFMLGTEKQLEEARQGQLTPLWKHLFPTIFSLACDVDLMINQLYQPLGEQLAHWYSSKIHMRSQQASTFLEALLNGITHQTDAALRDYCCICLHEYVEWSRKQGDVSAKVGPLLKRVISLCQHPCPHKRMGAALAFNNVYTVVREEATLVDEFWMELLHGFSSALSLCSLTGDDNFTEDQAEKSMDHVLRVLIHDKAVFNADNPQRRVPKEFAGGQLRHGVAWLLGQCTALNGRGRRKAMELVLRLAPYVSNCCSLHDFLEKIRVDEGPSKLFKIVEGSHLVDLQFLSSNQPLSWDKAMKGVHALIASVEFFVWLVQNDVSPKILLDFESSALLQNLSHFLNEVVSAPVHKSSLWRPKAMENFNTSKCCCIVRMIEFFTNLLEKSSGTVVQKFWNESLYQIITYSTLWPSHIGFDSNAKSVKQNLPNVLEHFFQALVQHTNPDVVNDLKVYFKKHTLLIAPGLLKDFYQSVRDDKVEQKYKDLVEGLQTLQKSFKDVPDWSGLTSDSILQTVFNGIVQDGLKAPLSPGPCAAAYAEALLRLSFCLSDEVKVLVALTGDATPLCRTALTGQLSHGEHFVISFKSVLVRRLLLHPLDFIRSILESLTPAALPNNLTILLAVLGSDLGSEAYLRENMKLLVTTLLCQWTTLSEWASNDFERESWLVSVLSEIVKLNLPLGSCSDNRSVSSWILERFTGSCYSLHFKTALISLLPLLTSSSETENDLVKTALNDLKDQHFPLHSTELSRGSEQYNGFVRAFEELLKSTVISGSTVMLQSVVKMMAVDRNHVCSHLLPSSLENFMNLRKQESAHHYRALMMVFDLFAAEAIPVGVRLRILNNFLVRLMQCASVHAQLLFSQDVIQKLVETVTSRLNLNDDSNMGKQKLVSHIGCWNLLQQIFGYLSRSHLEGKGSELVKAALASTNTVIATGKELVMLLTKKAIDALNETCEEDGSSDLKELRRSYFCAVYNMLATLICNLKTAAADLKFYEKFLFEENKKRFIWRNIVDHQKTYVEPYEHSINLKSIKQLVSIRRQVCNEMDGAKQSQANQTLSLLHSQTAIFSGTLEADITRFDFTHANVLTASHQETDMEVDSVVLEGDNLNNHECMAMLCGVIRHIVTSNISPSPGKLDNDPPSLPHWMVLLQSSMLDSTCPRNSCIFLLRMILNCEPYFTPYAFHWMTPLMECVAKHCLEHRISYFLGDLVHLLVKWSMIAPPSGSQRIAVNSILCFLIRNCYHNQREVFRFHLELVRSIVEVWKNYIDPPYAELFQIISHSDPRLGINLVAIFLFSNLAPWITETKSNYLRFLLKNLESTKNDICKMSAETIGLCLKYLNLASNGQLPEEDESYIASVVTYLKENVHRKQQDSDRFLTIMDALYDKHPTAIDPLLKIVLHYLVRTTGDMKAVCLSLLTSRSEVLGADAYRELKDRDIKSMLHDRNTSVQIKALQILQKLVPTLVEKDLLEVTDMISVVPQLDNREAREIAYDIALVSFDQYSSKKEIEMLTECESEILDQSKTILLWGLVDKNVDLQKKMFSLWTREERLPFAASERLIAILSSFYSPLTDDHFLTYGLELMLEGTVHTSDYDSAVFQHGLEECSFADYHVLSSWRAKNAPMAPMFAQTLASQMNKTESVNSSLGEESELLLATQNSLAFQPTAALQEDEIDSSIQGTGVKPVLKSSLIFSSSSQFVGSQSSRFSNRYKQGSGFGTLRLKLPENTVNDEGARASGFRSRRYLGKNASIQRFAMANVRRMKLKDEMQRERVRKREGQVAVFRKYRRGDFPDIQVKTADFIAPLREVAKRDSVVARKVLVSLFNGVMEKRCGPEEAVGYVSKVSPVIEKILNSSKSCEPSMVGSLMEIAYMHGIYFDPELLSSVSKRSGLLCTGVLLLESYLQLSNVEEEKIWLSLSELYDALGERDVAHAILLDRTRLRGAAVEALKAQAEERWLDAKMLYYEAVVQTEVDIFYESLFECMAHLSEWNDVSRTVRDQVEGNLDSLWEESWHEEKLLPRLVHSEVLKISQGNRDEHGFMDVIQKWLKDEEKSTVLKERFCGELLLLFLNSKKLPQARFYANKTLTKFIDNWAELDPLSTKQREHALLSVQQAAEALVYLGELGSIQSSDDVRELLKKLETVLPVSHDSLMLWETRISCRNLIMNQLPDHIKQETKTSVLKMQLCLIESALQQNNHTFAKKYLTKIQSEAEACDASVKVRWYIDRCQERHLWAKSSVEKKGPVQNLSNFLDIWGLLENVVASDDLDLHPQLSIAAHGIESSLCSSVKSLLSEEPLLWNALRRDNAAGHKWLSMKLQIKSNHTSDELLLALENFGLTSLTHSKNMTKSRHAESDEVADSYLRIAQYCRAVLEARPGPGTSAVDETFTRPLVQAIPSAMRYGSSTARQLFPLLLQLPNLSTQHSEDFKNRIDRVPEWMFLGWIPQLLACLDSDVASTVAPLLLKVAEKYPNAFLYPYNISRSKYETRQVASREIADLLQRLDAMLETNSVQIRLIQSLSCLSHPSVILEYYLKSIISALKKEQVDWPAVVQTCKTIFYEVLERDPESGAKIGDCGKLFDVLAQEDLLECLKSLYNAAMEECKVTASSAVKKLVDPKAGLTRAARRKVDGKMSEICKLKDLSPWLAEFSSSKLAVDIEIPGQYTGDRKPSPERHIFISAFSNTVQIMQSLRRPVKLTIIGSDACHHDFLVKFGEDLRQDERIQQLLSLMNGVFLSNAECRKRRLSLVVYKVIPLSSRLGVIEWVDNTASLNDLMETSLSENEKKIRHETRLKHSKWFSANQSPHVAVDRNNAIKMFSEMVSSVRLDALRCGLAQRSMSAEAFYSLRHIFITSYSTLCVAHWLLGVGDRHQSNCLMSLKSGQCIGIDFGHVFGTATQFLPIPELVPFRLTPHIVGLMAPLGSLGLIQDTMVHCLRALRADSEILLATMQVFILEPSLDWIQNSLRSAKPEESADIDSSSWLPKKKINQARRKLDGVNPVAIVEEDLQSGHGHKQIELDAFCKTLLGDRESSARRKLPRNGLSSRQQIECLIDLATDHDVLFKTYCGWEPWM